MVFDWDVGVVVFGKQLLLDFGRLVADDFKSLFFACGWVEPTNQLLYRGFGFAFGKKQVAFVLIFVWVFVFGNGAFVLLFVFGDGASVLLSVLL